MANWKYTIDVSDLWAAYRNKAQTIQEIARGLATRLRETIGERDVDEDLKTILEELDEIAEDNDDEIALQRFDGCALYDLYNWADYLHRLWLRTRP